MRDQSAVPTARNSERWERPGKSGAMPHHQIAANKQARKQEDAKRQARNLREITRLLQRDKVMRTGTKEQKVMQLLVDRLHGIRGAESVDALNRRYFGLLDMTCTANLSQTLGNLELLKINELALNAAEYRARELCKEEAA